MPILIPFGQCHGDELLLENVRYLNSDFIYILENYSLKLVLSLIANSEFYCGSSLHGYISALSYNVKGILIANESMIRFNKFSGFLNFYNNEACLLESWKNASNILPKIFENNIVNQDNSIDYFKTHREKINIIISNKKPERANRFNFNKFKIAKEINNFFK